MKKVLSTKTLNNEAIVYARQLNLDVHCIDFIETHEVERSNIPVPDSAFDAVVFTSSNAVKYFLLQPQALMLLDGKSVFALEGKTLNELKRINIQPVLTEKNAMALADIIIKREAATSILHVCGDMKLDVLENKLTGANIAYASLIVYSTTLLPNKVHALYDALMFYSPSGVESFLYNNTIAQSTVCCCIGETTAKALAEKDASANIRLPMQVSPVDMMDTIAKYFETR